MSALFNSTDPYWVACEAEVKALLDARPTTAAGVITILREHDPMPVGTYSGQAFWSAANGEVQLHSVLRQFGWHLDWAEADYYWVATSPTGESITYCEGDVSAGRPSGVGLECDQCTAEAGEECRPHCIAQED